jgi:hypothetical protein
MWTRIGLAIQTPRWLIACVVWFSVVYKGVIWVYAGSRLDHSVNQALPCHHGDATLVRSTWSA